MSASHSTSDERPWRFLPWLIVPVLLTAIILLIKWRKYATRDKVPPIPTAVISPMGPKGKREWSREVIHYPGLSIEKGYREWSHWEIAQRHKEFTLEELPDYVTELRGRSVEHETVGSGGTWLFVVPPIYLKEFEQYLIKMGIPPDCLYENRVTRLSSGYEDSGARPAPPPGGATGLVFAESFVSQGEGEILGAKFGKSTRSVNYFLINPNISRASLGIRVGWSNGNVQCYIQPLNPDWDK